MSSDVAIRVENLGKMYRIGGPQARYSTFRETLTDAFAAPFRRAGRLLRGRGSAADLDETIWALKDVSFEVKPGEVVGIIGRNGAGKSTLLKILSRITEPTEGSADIYGRVGSLLEVGTGFHPELTGRENVYLNGAILGMRRAEVDRNLDEIVAFAEIEKFLDTPVKHYSSGMYVRLAFAVAAHLEPQILLVDEVLAVGDAEFQKKCLGKLNQVATAGRTVFFVSHNMAAIQALCGRVIVLVDGQIGFDGETTTGVQTYLSVDSPLNSTLDLTPWLRGGTEGSVRRLRVMNSGLQPCTLFPVGSDAVIEVDLFESNETRAPQIGIGVVNAVGTRVFTVLPRYKGITLPGFREWMTVRCTLREMRLVPGRYFLRIVYGDRSGDREWIDNVPAFEIAATDFWGFGELPTPIAQGVVVQDAQWATQSEDSGFDSLETCVERGDAEEPG